MLLLNDNALAHTLKIAEIAIRDCGFEETSHPPYSPDLAPSYFYLFRLLKKHLHGRRFSDDDELKTISEQYLEGVGKDFYGKGIRVARTLE